MPHWRVALWLLALAAYVGLSHWLTVHAAAEAWSLAAFAAPPWIAGLLVALRSRSRPALAALAAVALLIAIVVARGGIGDVHRLWLLQHAGIHALLGVVFARSLAAGHTPAITAVAERVHRSLTPAMRSYTRKVTVAWMFYFFGMAVLSLVVHALFDLAVWSTLANILTPLAIGALFGGEFLLRYRLHPEFERAGLIASMRAWQQGTPR